MRELTVSAPGRICLFGEHQDFLGLPVVAAAIDLRIYIEGVRRSDSLLKLEMPDVGTADQIDLSKPIVYTRSRDYLRAGINVLRRRDWDLWPGYDCRIHGDIPINAGVSSSSALIVAWMKFLLEASGDAGAYSADDIARLAHQAEVVEFGEPGGMMDHFASALGGMVYVDCRPPFRAERLPLHLDGFVLGDSLENKETLGVLSDSKTDVQEGLRVLSEFCPGFDLHSTPIEAVDSLLDRVPEPMARKVRANLVNRDLTVEAMRLFREGVEPARLGDLLTRQHEQLRGGIGVSTRKIDRMVEAALAVGALGAKINGSGGGGCMFAYAPGREDAVAEALVRVGGKAYKVSIDEGARVEGAES
ncbi:MAG TPA: galactokinase family protein [Armatimonadota bacterium]|nr:galactokinase family protein [Armatimonadota bacterium]